jgi:hypothetical protein
LADSGKPKVFHHVGGKDLDAAKYPMVLIDKHIEAEGGPDKIDIVLALDGPALNLYIKP